jgi:hypothetical protein
MEEEDGNRQLCIVRRSFRAESGIGEAPSLMFVFSFYTSTVEVRLSPTAPIRFNVVKDVVESYIIENFDRLEIGAELDGWREVTLLETHVERVVVAECGESEEKTVYRCK